MSIWFISEASFTKLLDALAEQGPVLKCGAAADSAFAAYVPHKAGEAFTYSGFRASASLKGLLFPPREKVAEYPAAPSETPEPDQPPTVVGAANCDLKALASLDAVFCEQNYADGFYAERRRKMLIITQDCTAPRSTCACAYVGLKPYPEEGFDLNLSQVSGGYVIETRSEKGRQLMEAHSALAGAAKQDAVAERDAKRLAALTAVYRINADYKTAASRRELLRRQDADKPWLETVSTCVECAACLFACPTCHCFLLYDQKAPKAFERVKAWDACSYAGYARMAGGGTPRPLLLDRFRHRYWHKFDYFVANHGFEMCSGCGRCIEACAGKIDMRKVFKALESAALTAESGNQKLQAGK